MTDSQIPAFVRTYVPLLIAALVGWLADLGVILPDGTSTLLITTVSALAGAVWYAAVRWLEHRWPSLGVLLGSTRTPTYSQPPVTDAPTITHEAESAALSETLARSDDGPDLNLDGRHSA